MKLKEWFWPIMGLNLIIGVPCSLFLPEDDWRASWVIRMVIILLWVIGVAYQELGARKRSGQ